MNSNHQDSPSFLQPSPPQEQMANRDNFLMELTQWENAMPGENRSQTVKQVMQCCDANSSRLILKDLDSTSTLPPMPVQVTELWVLKCPGLVSFSTALPAQLAHLAVANCPELNGLPDLLPPSLQHLSLIQCPKLIALPSTLPRSLTYLNIKECALKALPVLPTRLTTLMLTLCDELSISFDLIPNSLRELCIVNCLGVTEVTALPNPLPVGLTRLHLIGWYGLAHLPNALPPNLKDFNITNCLALTGLPHPLPVQLACLNVSGCTGLTALLIPLPVALKTIIGAELLPLRSQEEQEIMMSKTPVAT